MSKQLQVIQANGRISDDQARVIAIRNIGRADKLSKSSKDQYIRAINLYCGDSRSLLDTNALADYKALETTSKTDWNFLCAAMKRMTKEAEINVKGAYAPNMDPTDKMNLDIFQENLKGLAMTLQPYGKPKGKKIPTWLSLAERDEIYQACYIRKTGKDEDPIIALRDRVLLGIAFETGMRRAEICAIKFSDLKMVPTKSGRKRPVFEIIGKGDKARQVAIRDSLAVLIDEWRQVVKDGKIARSISFKGVIKDSMTPLNLFKSVVEKRAALVKIPNLKPHDCRRTFAQIHREAGTPIENISLLLGHSSLDTTMIYLDVKIDLEVDPALVMDGTNESGY